MSHDPRTQNDAPEAILAAIQEPVEGDEAHLDERIGRLVERFPPEALEAVARRGLHDLSGPRGELVLRLVEAVASPGLLEALAGALVAQPDLPPERAWVALDLLQGTGLIEATPELTERWEDLAELLEGDEASLEELAAQLEETPDGPWLALQGLGAVEPEIRASIVAGLAGQPIGAGLVEFLRLLSFVHDPATRAAALDALSRAVADPRLIAAWAAIAAEHPDPAVVDRARLWLDPRAERDTVVRALAARPRPRLARSLVTALDGRGQGSIVLMAEESGRWVAAAFLCDVLRGVREVVGQAGPDPHSAETLLAEFAARPQADVVEDAPELALGLLAGSLLLCGPSAPPALRPWLEGTAGPDFRARPFPGLIRAEEPAGWSLAEMSGPARSVLASCPSWVDDSDLTYELAEEILLREGDTPSDPRRDAGAYRYLFEHRLSGRLELYRRMLFWMASFWHASGAADLGRSALALAHQVSDPQHAVPGHPFIVALTSQSLSAAQANLRRGLDLRDPATRARQAGGDWP